MNLLHDKRDNENKVPKPDFHEVTPPPRLDDQPKLDLPENPAPFPEHNVPGKKKSSGKAFLITLILLIVVSAAAYFIFFKDAFNIFNKQPQQQTFVHESQGDFVDPNEKSNVSEPIVNDQKKVPESTSDDTTGQPIVQQEEQPIVEKPQESVNVAGDNGFTAIASTMNQLQQIVTGSNKINTLFFDENTFWAELQATDINAANELYSSIQTNLSSFIRVTSQKPSNTKFLISGNVTISATISVQPVLKTDVQTLIRSAAGQTAVNMTTSEVSSGSSGGHNVFCKVSGSLGNCSKYIQSLGKAGWGIKISKVILTPASGGNVELTLRFTVR